MREPLIHIFTATIAEGQVEGYRQYAREHAEFVEAKHPGLLAFHLYLDEDARKVAAVQVHPDADSMDFFMKEVVAEHGVKAYEFVEQGSERSEVYGVLNDGTRDQIEHYGVPLSLHPQHLGGFTRLAGG